MLLVEHFLFTLPDAGLGILSFNFGLLLVVEISLAISLLIHLLAVLELFD